MTTSPKKIWFDDMSMWVQIEDGRIIGVPLEWFPRLQDATEQQRLEYEFSTYGIHWNNLDEDISISGLLAGNGDLTTLHQKSA